MGFWGKVAATATFGLAGYLGARAVEKHERHEKKEREEKHGLREENADLKRQLEERQANEVAAEETAIDYDLLLALESGQGNNHSDV